MLFTAIALLPELTVAVPSNNDDATHFLLIQRASEALANGENVLDHWVPQLELGFPWFIYYQPLPALLVVLLHRALLGLVDLLTVFNAVRYVLLVGLPITVFWSLRRMGVAAAGAAMAAAASPLLSGDFRYGFDYASYIWRGFGMFPQLAAVHLPVVTVAVAATPRAWPWASLPLSFGSEHHSRAPPSCSLSHGWCSISGARRSTDSSRFSRCTTVSCCIASSEASSSSRSC